MSRGLSGRRIVVTRPRAQAADFCQRLAALGAQPILCPTIKIAPIPESAPFRVALAGLDSFDWIIFTSANSVTAFCEGAKQLGSAVTSIHPHIAAIGPATARELQRHGLEPALVPDTHVAEGLLDAIGPVRGRRILFPRAAEARDALAAGLRARGAEVTEVAVYHILPSAPDPDTIAELRRGVDAVTFTSSSAVRNFAPLRTHLPEPPAIACLGPITAQTAREAGFNVTVIAHIFTTEGLLSALIDHYTP